MYKPHHGPMSNDWVLISFLGIIIALSIWKLTPAWGFLIILFSIIVFFSSYISAIRAPLMSDEEIEIAVHEKYHGRKYPDTELHHGHVPKSKKYAHSRHKKKLIQIHLEELLGSRKPVRKQAAAKKAVKKPSKRVSTPAKKQAAPKRRQPATKKRPSRRR